MRQVHTTLMATNHILTTRLLLLSSHEVRIFSPVKVRFVCLAGESNCRRPANTAKENAGIVKSSLWPNCRICVDVRGRLRRSGIGYRINEVDLDSRPYAHRQDHAKTCTRG